VKTRREKADADTPDEDSLRRARAWVEELLESGERAELNARGEVVGAAAAAAAKKKCEKNRR
jgi:hypothetical protein